MIERPLSCPIRRHAVTHSEGRLRGRRRQWLVALGVIVVLALPVAAARAASGDLDLVSRASGATGAAGNFPASAAAISSDGRFVTFYTAASNLVPDDSDGFDDVYVRDLQTGTTTLVSRASGATGANSNRNAYGVSLSADGRLATFSSYATNLSSGDSDATSDVFVRDLEANTTTLVSRAAGVNGAKGDGHSYLERLSADGRFVAFHSLASNLSADDGDAIGDVYVRDMQANTTTLVSRASGASGAKGNGVSFPGSLSADGRFVAFTSSATNLSSDDGDTTSDVFVRDLQTNTTTLVSRAGGADGAKGNGYSTGAKLSRDGRFMAFSSEASNLSPDDGDSSTDAFVRDLQTNTTTLVSRAVGASGAKANGEAWAQSISGDGRFVALESDATNLSPDDGDAMWDVFVRDLQRNTIVLASRAAGATGAKGNGDAFTAALSGDGRFLAFSSQASNLHPDDVDSNMDVFRRELGNNQPSAAADTYVTAHDTPLTVVAPGVLANDSDPDHEPLRAELVSAPAHGTLALNADGSFTYSPARGYSGADSFAYGASDGEADSTAATVAITVHGAPPPPQAPSSPVAPAKPLCQGRPATIVGTAGQDVLRGTPRADVIVALDGNDIVRGLRGNDRICAGAGHDRVQGGAGNDRLTGGTGRDMLGGSAGDDRINARDGRRETVRCGGGNDRVSADRRDKAFGCERIARR